MHWFVHLQRCSCLTFTYRILRLMVLIFMEIGKRVAHIGNLFTFAGRKTAARAAPFILNFWLHTLRANSMRTKHTQKHSFFPTCCATISLMHSFLIEDRAYIPGVTERLHNKRIFRVWKIPGRAYNKCRIQSTALHRIGICITWQNCYFFIDA